MVKPSSSYRPWVALAALLLMFAAGALAQSGEVSAATRTQFTDRPSFESALTPGTEITDGYSPAHGYPAGFGVYGNAAMSAFFGETDYESTGHSNVNIISGETYCAGCNGSFRLTFTSTSATVGGVGVFGVGLNILTNSSALPYWAYVTYGDGTTENFALPVGSSFFGLTSPDLIANIHFGLQNGGTTTAGSFQIDNLSIGAGEGGGEPAACRLFGTTGYGGGRTSTLMEMDPDTGEIIREIGSVGFLCNGLDYDATTGRLYCGTSINDEKWNGLVGVDLDSGQGTPVGENYWGYGEPIPVTNITVDSGGQMYGWSEWTDSLVRIDKGNGVLEEIFPNYVGTYQNGLSFNSSDRLYMINGDGGIYRIDPGSGEASYEGSFRESAHHGDFNPQTDLYYGLTWTYGDPRVLLRCDIEQQYCEYLAEVKDMHTLAWVCEEGGEPPDSQSDLRISKTVSPSPLIAGETGTYTIVSTNLGPDPAYDVTITEYDVQGAQLQSVTCAGGTISIETGRVVCTWPGPTEVGQSRTMVLVGRVCPERKCGTVITNRAETRAGSGGGGGGELRLFGSMGYGGERSTLYELGPENGEILSEIGPIGHTLNGLAYDRTTGRLYGGVSYTDASFNGLVELDPSTGAVLTYGEWGWGMGGVAVTNIAINASGDMYGWSEWCDCLVRIDKSTGVAEEVGYSGIGTARYGLAFDTSDRLFLVNYGGEVYEIDVSTGYATYYSYIGWEAHHGEFHPDTNLYYGLTNWDPRYVVRCDIDGGGCEQTAEVGRMHVLAFVMGEGGGGGGSSDPNPSNNTVTLDTPVQARSRLTVSKSDSPDPVIAGQNLTYTFVVSNAGPSNADQVVVQDILNPYLKYLSATSTPTGVTCTANGQTVRCTIPTLGAPGQCTTSFPTQYTITMVVAVSDRTPSSVAPCTGPPLTNTVTIASQNCLPDTGTLSATAITNVLAGSDVEVQPAVVTTRDSCIGPGAYLDIQYTFGNTGPRAYSVQHDNDGPEFVATIPERAVGVSGSCIVLEGGGTCEVSGSQVFWNGEIPVGGTVTLTYRVRVKGGTPFGTEMCFVGEVRYDQCNTGQNDATRVAEQEECTVTDCPSVIDPNRQLGMQVHLPILNYIGNDDRCNTWLEVQAIGPEAMKAVLVTWGEPGFCPPQAAGPLKVECTGLLKPGSTWNLLTNQIPTGSKSGMLFKFSNKQLSDFGLDEIFGFDDIFADLMCETLFFGVVGDADDFRRFKKAYNEGGNFAGIPQDLASGSEEGGILAVEVLRDCPGDQTAGVRVTSKYNGIAGSHLGEYDPVYGGYTYYVPLVYADKAGFTSWIYIQNGGLECSSVEIWFKDQEDCMRARICEVSTLAPGETLQFDPNDCVSQFQGSAWVRTSQPMGIAVDIAGRDVLMTYVGEPAELNYTFSPDQLTSPGNQVAFGPLIYSEYQGWDSGIQVQNLSPLLPAKVKVYFLDRSGDVITTLVDWICPRGSQTFFLPVVHDLPGSWVGSVRVESQEWVTPGGPLVLPPNIVAVATLIRYTDAQRTETREAIAYNLLPEHKIFDWQVGGAGGGGLESGVGLIAIPSLLKDLQGTGVTSELAIANVVPKPGFTDFAIYLYDQNGLLDFVCQKLNEKQVEYIDLQTWGYVSNGFKGSAIISAVFWEHDVFADDGFFLRNIVGLGAVAIERSKTRLNEDIGGDEAAGSRGIPFKQSDIEGEEFTFGFMGGVAPVCVGIPVQRPEPGQCPAEVTFQCDNCPVPLPDLSTTNGFVSAAIPSGCRVTDVDVLVDISHTYNGDLIATLVNPDGLRVPLWSGICGASDGIQAILDDEASQPIGAVCPPSGFQRWNTDPAGGLTLLEGEPGNGRWTLELRDQYGGDQGTLNNWSLTFRTQ